MQLTYNPQPSLHQPWRARYNHSSSAYRPNCDSRSTNTSSPAHSTTSIDHDAHGASYPGILLACRQLRSEAMPFIYRLSRFYATEVRWELNSRCLRRLPVGSRVSVFDRAAVCQHNAALKGDVSSLRLRGQWRTEKGGESLACETGRWIWDGAK